MEGMGLKVTPIIETSLRPSKHVWTYGWHFLESQLVQTVLTEGLTHLSLPTQVAQNPTVLASNKNQNPTVLDSNQKYSYKTLANRLFQLYSISGVATTQHKKTTVVSIFKIVIS